LELVAVDYNNPSTLEAALKGVDVVVSTLCVVYIVADDLTLSHWPSAGGGFAQQPALAKAAKASGVKLIVPSEWGGNTLDEPAESFLRGKRDFRESLPGLGLPYLAVFTGPFSDTANWFFSCAHSFSRGLRGL
jgi:hypothetical protein